MDDERLDVFFNSVNFMANAAHKDKKAYEAYKRNQEVIEGASIEELEILSILDELGYPLGEIGTYLYKALIVNVLNYLRGVPIRREVLSEEELKEQLSNPFSQLFFDIARNDMDLGIKTFHAAISRASANVDSENVNRKLSEEIFSGNFEPMDYSLNALDIAKYYFVLRDFRKNNKKLNRLARMNNKVMAGNFANLD